MKIKKSKDKDATPEVSHKSCSAIGTRLIVKYNFGQDYTAHLHLENGYYIFVLHHNISVIICLPTCVFCAIYKCFSQVLDVQELVSISL